MAAKFLPHDIISNRYITSEIIKKFDVSGPRYTSYPTADRFVEAFSSEQYIEALKTRYVGGVALPLSIYVHIPFCESLCFYCACNKVITERHERGAEYLQYLRKEIALYSAHINTEQVVNSIHLGGGTPTFFTDEELSELMRMLREHFTLAEDGEYSIEIDPRTVDSKRLAHFASLGFNRLSFGVQDIEPAVQKAVHRIQPVQNIFDLVNDARMLGFDSINLDLIYGLPKQTPHSFAKTAATVNTLLKPDRIALYAYAHLPERFKAQRNIELKDLPKAHDKIAMLENAMNAFQDAGYAYIGMDHFSLPNDPLAKAKRLGTLHRNFQGYSTQPNCDLIGLGVSAIGGIGATYSQNAKTLDEYYDDLDQDRFPVVHGLALSHDDLVRREVIMALMCQGHLQFESIELSFLIEFKTYFSTELDALQCLVSDGLVEVESNAIQVTTLGWFFVRGIAMLFDRYLQADNNRTRFSKII